MNANAAITGSWSMGSNCLSIENDLVHSTAQVLASDPMCPSSASTSTRKRSPLCGWDCPRRFDRFRAAEYSRPSRPAANHSLSAATLCALSNTVGVSRASASSAGWRATTAVSYIKLIIPVI
jgi:hypothetical protein